MYAKDFFSPADKCMIINFILERAQFSEDALDVGMAKLLNDNVYKAAYPLHDVNILQIHPTSFEI